MSDLEQLRKKIQQKKNKNPQSPQPLQPLQPSFLPVANGDKEKKNLDIINQEQYSGSKQTNFDKQVNQRKLQHRDKGDDVNSLLSKIMSKKQNESKQKEINEKRIENSQIVQKDQVQQDKQNNLNAFTSKDMLVQDEHEFYSENQAENKEPKLLEIEQKDGEPVDRYKQQQKNFNKQNNEQSLIQEQQQQNIQSFDENNRLMEVQELNKGVNDGADLDKNKDEIESNNESKMNYEENIQLPDEALDQKNNRKKCRFDLNYVIQKMASYESQGWKIPKTEPIQFFEKSNIGNVNKLQRLIYTLKDLLSDYQSKQLIHNKQPFSVTLEALKKELQRLQKTKSVI